MMPDGFLKFVVNNVADLDVLLMHNRKYAAEVSRGFLVFLKKAVPAGAYVRHLL